VQQEDNISTDTERRAGLLAIAKLLVLLSPKAFSVTGREHEFGRSSHVPLLDVLLAWRLRVDGVRRQRLKGHGRGGVGSAGARHWLIVAGVEDDWRGGDRHRRRRLARLVCVALRVALAATGLGARSAAGADWSLPAVRADGEDEDQQQDDERRRDANDEDDVHADRRHRVGTTLVLTAETTVTLSGCHDVRGRWRGSGRLSAVAVACRRRRARWTRLAVERAC